ncbi:MAG: hypothetical protein GY801_26560 [bacterium]|nr:hypothetical protein [bacterium]
MSTKYVKDPPEWFITRDYTYTTDLDAEGWLIAFFYRSLFDPIPESREFFVSEETDPWEMLRNKYPTKKDCFDAYLEKTHPPPGHFKDGHDFPAIKEITSIDDAEKTLNKKHLALVAVELDASEGTTIKQFAEWPEERKREHVVPSFVRRGPSKTLNRMLTAEILARWSRQRILELWDLLFWKKLFGENVSETNLAFWLFPEETARSRSDPRDIVRQSMDVLKNAVELIIPLHFEVGNGE